MNQTDENTNAEVDQPSIKTLIIDGLWRNNPGMVQLLGLCPLLAISNTTVNALGLGLATLITLLVSSISVSAIRSYVAAEIRIPLFILLIASTVTIIELITNAWFHQLYLVLGIFLPLIVTNCMILGRAESFARRHGITQSAVDALAHGSGFLLVLVCLGAMREVLGHGTLLRDAQFLFGETAIDWRIQILNPASDSTNDSNRGILLALLPPGAFMMLGLLLALRNYINQYFIPGVKDTHSTVELEHVR